MTEIPNLWESIDEEQYNKIITPNDILIRQASYLENESKALIKGIIARSSRDNSIFDLVFAIVAPTLNNYSINLFRITHDVALYPLSFTPLIPFKERTGSSFQIKDQKDFIDTLRLFFNSENVRKIRLGLMAQLKS